MAKDASDLQLPLACNFFLYSTTFAPIRTSLTHVLTPVCVCIIGFLPFGCVQHVHLMYVYLVGGHLQFRLGLSASTLERE